MARKFLILGKYTQSGLAHWLTGSNPDVKS